MTQIINFIFSKEAFSGITTIAAGLVALIVYWLHKQDEKIKAARIILAEIRNAESQITKIKNEGIVSDFSSILPFNGWQQFSHLFVKTLDRDELDLINNFYIACTLTETELRRLKSFLPLAMEEKARIIQVKLLELADKYKSEEKIDLYQKEKDAILHIFHNEDYWFLPKAPKEKLLQYLTNIQFVTTTTAGTKLKKLAKLD